MDIVARYQPPAEPDGPELSGPERRKTEARGVAPSRTRAALLTLFFGSGVGHFYLGRPRRAVLWAAVPGLLHGLGCLFVPHLPAQTGFLVFMAGVAALIVARFVALIELRLLHERESHAVPLWHVVAFWVATVVYTTGGQLYLRTYVVQAFKIPSGSMMPSLMPQDHLLIDQTAFRNAPPKRGEIAVFTDPSHPNQDFIKRVIGLPGDRVEVHEGHVLINGWPVPYCTVAQAAKIPYSIEGAERGVARGRIDVEFLGSESFLVLLEDDREEEDKGTWIVNPGEYFVVGDNRMNSADSRSWFGGRGGGVPFANSIGRPLFVWLAFAPDGSVDWPRLGQAVAGAHVPFALHEFEPALAECLRRRPAQTEPPHAG